MVTAPGEEIRTNGNKTWITVAAIVIPLAIAVGTAFIAWGAVSSGYAAHEKRLDVVEHTQLNDGRDISVLKDGVKNIREDVKGLQADIKELIKETRNSRGYRGR